MFDQGVTHGQGLHSGFAVVQQVAVSAVSVFGDGAVLGSFCAPGDGVLVGGAVAQAVVGLDVPSDSAGHRAGLRAFVDHMGVCHRQRCVVGARDG